jgi:hypothetical protein
MTPSPYGYGEEDMDDEDWDEYVASLEEEQDQEDDGF